MKPDEYVDRYIRISGPKDMIDQEVSGLVATLFCCGKAKNGKWYPISLYAVSTMRKEEASPGLIAAKTEVLILTIKTLLWDRLGLKKYRGYFKFDEVEPYSKTRVVERPTNPRTLKRIIKNFG